MTDGTHDTPAANDAIIDEATGWLVRLRSGSVKGSDLEALARWRTSHPAREAVWQRLMAIEGDFEGLAPGDRAIATATLDRAHQRLGRRRALKTLGWAAIGGGLAWGGAHTPMARRLWADHSTAVGEKARIDLPDGAQIRLNTDTILDVNRSVAHLRRGEIHVTTASGAAPQPVTVETAHGAFAPARARFLLRDLGTATRLSVLDGSVVMRPTGSATRTAHTSQSWLVSERRLTLDPLFDRLDPGAWLEGLLVVKRMRLGDVVAELARYRVGLIHVTDDAAGLAVSGVYRLDSIDDALSALEASLPVSVMAITPYLTIIRTA